MANLRRSGVTLINYSAGSFMCYTKSLWIQLKSVLFHNDSLFVCFSLSACGSCINRAFQVSEIEKVHSTRKHARTHTHQHKLKDRLPKNGQRVTNTIHTHPHTQFACCCFCVKVESHGTSHLINNFRYSRFCFSSHYVTLSLYSCFIVQAYPWWQQSKHQIPFSLFFVRFFNMKY